jgi:hypothetical protein
MNHCKKCGEKIYDSYVKPYFDKNWASFKKEEIQYTLTDVEREIIITKIKN